MIAQSLRNRFRNHTSCPHQSGIDFLTDAMCPSQDCHLWTDARVAYTLSPSSAPAYDSLIPESLTHAKSRPNIRAMEEPSKGVQTLGHYRLGSRLGEGGMGVVYLADDTQLERTVAIKLVSEKLVDSDSRQLLLAGARTASALNHPNICTIHEVGQSDGLTFILCRPWKGRRRSGSS